MCEFALAYIYLNSTFGELTISFRKPRQFLSKKSFLSKYEFLMEVVVSLYHAGVPVIPWFFFLIVLHVTQSSKGLL